MYGHALRMRGNFGALPEILPDLEWGQSCDDYCKTAPSRSACMTRCENAELPLVDPATGGEPKKAGGGLSWSTTLGIAASLVAVAAVLSAMGSSGRRRRAMA